MARYALVFPALEGKSDADLKSIAEMFRADPDGYRASRRRHGVTLERAYLQKTPMGSFVVGYQESERDLMDTLGSLAASDLAIDRRFVEMVRDLHGIDLTQPMPGPVPETLAAWVDPQVTVPRRGMAFTAPMAPGKTEAGRAFVKEAFEARRGELEASRRALGENKEVITLQPTPMGDVINVYLEGNDPWEGNRGFAASTTQYDVWFKGMLGDLFPREIDLTKPVEGVSEIFDSEKVGG
ncbi:MAG TPA: hypothetical protein VFA92_15655 [Candidatus Binatia bacterium]|jgi:hypothetical protein|nr:hypothetical protein [Candidatus Binatia bacterium]